MDIEINPFHELYVTESASAKEFVKLFSAIHVEHTQLLFQQGNVVLKGTQGSGKSMLLNLLKPEIRKAFYKESTDYPVPKKLTNFIGAGINLTRCGALDIGQRPISSTLEEEERIFPLYFSDFLNYWVVRDILKSIKYIAENPDVFNSIVDSNYFDMFAMHLSKEDCWSGYFKGDIRFENIIKLIEERISIYRQFNQYNIEEMPKELKDTKTAIGQPISRTAECLLKTKVLQKGTQLFIRIDQYEILYRSPELRPNLRKSYRQIINKALSTRDPNISYKIGTRSYAWDEEITVFGTKFCLEKERDYREIDLDEVLRRHEDPKPWIFPDFAVDVFRRRLEHANYEVSIVNPLREVMGKSPDPKEMAKKYSGTSNAIRALRIDTEWPKEWKDFLIEFYQESPLSAKLAQVWARQRGTEKNAGQRLKSPPPIDQNPWGRTYWRKERTRQALMQIASSCGQRLLWWGEKNILSLSMGSILVFVSVCQHIWDAFLRSERGRRKEEKRNPIKDGIEGNVQAVAIQTASEYWYKKINERTGGSSRQRFIDYIGRLFQKELLYDKAMSYPGNNGFSLLKEELEADAEVTQFLGDAVDYGDLVRVPHTTKTIDRRQRIKWYLNPILSPCFRIPESHIKEPMYVKISEVRVWLKKAKIALEDIREDQKNPKPADQQLDLFKMKINKRK